MIIQATKKNINVEISKLKAELEKTENKIKKLVVNSNLSGETSNFYWSNIERQSKMLYEEMRFTFAKYSKKNIEVFYDKSVQEQIKRAKHLKITLPFIDPSKFVNNDISTRTKKIITENTINDFTIGLNSGEKNMNRLFQAAQEVNITQKRLDELMTEGWSENKSIYGVKKKLQQELLQKAVDGKYVTVIDKNGSVRSYDVKYYAEMVTRTQLRNAQTNAVVNIATELESDLIQVSSHNTLTPYDATFEGKIFSISGNDKDFPPVEDLPPFHVNCFKKGTLVLTENGIKNIEDIDINDKCLSLNIENKSIEYIKVKSKIFQEKQNIINFYSKYFSLSVTDNHNMVFMSDWNRRNKLNLKFEKAINLINKKSGCFYSGCEWNGTKTKDDLLVEFMGYYLSEGSVYKPKNCWNTYCISIAQNKIVNKDKFEKMLNCVKSLFSNKHFCIDLNGIRFYDSELGKFLIELGKSHEKYIPDFIKNSDKQQIRIFLDAYNLGDGSITKPKLFNNYFFNGSKSYFTSSRKMASDIIELILKVGKRPSLKINKCKGNICKFKNGEYKINNDLYIITECNSNYLTFQNIKSSIEKNKSDVYCVELEKNNTLYVSGKSSFLWAGNCLHSISVFFKEALPDKTIQELSDFSLGKTEEHPYKTSYVPLSQREF